MTVLDLIPQTERETLKFRLLAILVVAFAFLLRHDEVPYPPTLGLIGGYLVYNYILRSVLIPRFTSYPLLGIMLLIDVGTVLGALQLIGLDSPIFGLLPVVVVYYSLYMGYAGGISAAVVSTLSFTSLVFATGQVEEMESILALQPFFYILGLLVGYITQQRFRESQERRSLQQLISAEANAKTLLDLAQALNRVMDSDAVYTDVSKLGALVARVPYCAIFAHDPERSVLVYQGSNRSEGPPVGSNGLEFSVPLDRESLLSSAWTGGKAEYRDVRDVSGDGMAKWLEDLEAVKVVACPLESQGEKVGVICFVATEGAFSFDDGTMQAVETFSDIAGRMVATTRLYDRAERRSRTLASDLQQSVEMSGRIKDLSQRRSMRFGPLVIEPGRELVRWQDTNLRLTKTEFDLLYVLASNSGNVMNQETLTREVWGLDYVPQGKVVDVTVHRLRRKLAGLPEGGKLIRTVRGQGYTFEPPERFARA